MLKNINPIHPLFLPIAEKLAGDLVSYFNEHRHFFKGDYTIIRSYYIENNLLKPWCNKYIRSQIVLLGSGLDTRAYRLESFLNTHTISEVDFPLINHYEEEVLRNEKPLCILRSISTDISRPKWPDYLIKNEFSHEIYIEREKVIYLLQKLQI